MLSNSHKLIFVSFLFLFQNAIAQNSGSSEESLPDIPTNAKIDKGNQEMKIIEIKQDAIEDDIHFIVEEMPEFPGGIEELYKFIGSNLKYPKEARENNVEGLCIVQFVVNEDGSISNIRLLKDIGSGCGEEVMRIVALMPNWKPGYQRGNKVKVQYNLPIRFKNESTTNKQKKRSLKK